MQLSYTEKLCSISIQGKQQMKGRHGDFETWTRKHVD